jgi:hypothetical protein
MSIFKIPTEFQKFQIIGIDFMDRKVYYKVREEKNMAKKKSVKKTKTKSKKKASKK